MKSGTTVFDIYILYSIVQSSKYLPYLMLVAIVEHLQCQCVLHTKSIWHYTVVRCFLDMHSIAIHVQVLTIICILSLNVHAPLMCTELEQVFCLICVVLSNASLIFTQVFGFDDLCVMLFNELTVLCFGTNLMHDESHIFIMCLLWNMCTP